MDEGDESTGALRSIAMKDMRYSGAPSMHAVIACAC